jgi:hypothetical protein
MPSTNDTSGSSHCLGHPHHGLVYGKNSWPDTALFFHGKIHGKSRCRDSRRAPHWVQMVPQWIVAPQYIHPAWRCLVKPLTSGFFLWDLTMGFNYELIGFSGDFYEIYMVTIVRWEKNMGFSHRTMIFQPCTHISHIYICIIYTHTYIIYYNTYPRKMRHQIGCMRGILKLPAMGRFHRHRRTAPGTTNAWWKMPRARVLECSAVVRRRSLRRVKKRAAVAKMRYSMWPKWVAQI